MLFNPFFWGFFFVLLGGLLLLKWIFRLNIRVSKIAFWILLLAVISYLIGLGSNNKILSGANKYIIPDTDNTTSYSVITSKQTIDLTNLRGSEEPVHINVVAGKCLVYVKDKSNFRIKSKSAFGSIEFPEDVKILFGTYTYASSRYKPNKDPLEIRVSVFAGKIEVYEK